MRALIRHPLVGVALSFVLGTRLGLSMDLPLAAGLAAAGILLLGSAAWLARSWKRTESLSGPAPIPWLSCSTLHAGLLLLAWVHAGNARRSQSPLGTDPAWDGQAVEIIGRVDDDPEVTKKGRSRMERFPLHIEKTRLAGNTPWIPGSATVHVHRRAADEDPAAAYGDRWFITGFLRDRPPAESGLWVRRLAASVPPAEAERIQTGQGSTWIARCLRWRAALRRRLHLGIEGHPRELAILDSLLLGYRSRMPGELFQTFAATGTLHIFAISGSHVVVLASVFTVILRLLRVARPWWVLYTGPLLAAYTIMTGLQPSAVRALLMAIFFLAGPLVGRRPDFFSAVSLAALVILAVRPQELINPGFLMSFAAVIGIVLLYPTFAALLTRPFRADPLHMRLPGVTPPLSQRVGVGIGRFLATSLAAWLVSTPLTLYFFGMFSPVALVGNLLAIPLAAVILTTGALSVVSGSGLGLFSEVFNHANLLFASILDHSMTFLGQLSWGHWTTDRPSPLWMATCYAVIGLWSMAGSHQSGPDPVASNRNDTEAAGGGGACCVIMMTPKQVA